MLPKAYLQMRTGVLTSGELVEKVEFNLPIYIGPAKSRSVSGGHHSPAIYINCRNNPACLQLQLAKFLLVA